MLKNTDELYQAFQKKIKESKDTYGDSIEEIRALALNVSSSFSVALEKVPNSKWANSIVFWTYVESVRASGHIIFLTSCGLYRNAFDNIRHLLESFVQASYVETNHSTCDLSTKIEILKEIEDKKEYHARRLIEEKNLLGNMDCKHIDCKGMLKNEYISLSRIVHPSHSKVLAVLKDVKGQDGLPTTLDKNEIKAILGSLKRAYDIVFLLIFATFPEIKESLLKDTKIKEYVKKYELSMLDKVLTS